jgi:hypothetical protein
MDAAGWSGPSPRNPEPAALAKPAVRLPGALRAHNPSWRPSRRRTTITDAFPRVCVDQRTREQAGHDAREDNFARHDAGRPLLGCRGLEHNGA